jgi:hypothetical protein
MGAFRRPRRENSIFVLKSSEGKFLLCSLKIRWDKPTKDKLIEEKTHNYVHGDHIVTGCRALGGR